MNSTGLQEQFFPHGPLKVALYELISSMQGQCMCQEGKRTVTGVVWLRTGMSFPESCVITDDGRDEVKGCVLSDAHGHRA